MQQQLPRRWTGLIGYFLIDRTSGKIRASQVGEALIKCQAKNDGTLPYIIENGVIKARKSGYDRK